MKTHFLAFLALLSAGVMARASSPAVAAEGTTPALQIPKAAPAAPESAPKALEAGDLAPDFALPGSDGKTYRLSDFKGKRAVVVAWFPKAFTGG